MKLLHLLSADTVARLKPCNYDRSEAEQLVREARKCRRAEELLCAKVGMDALQVRAHEHGHSVIFSYPDGWLDTPAHLDAVEDVQRMVS